MATASDKLREEMETALNNVRDELARIEILAAALDAFNSPVPDYRRRSITSIRANSTASNCRAAQAVRP